MEEEEEEEDVVVVHLFSSLDSSMQEHKRKCTRCGTKAVRKLQIKQSTCNYANAVLTPSMLLTLIGIFAR